MTPGTAKLAFITGASSGLGRALAWRCHQAGFRVALVARRTNEVEAWAKSLKINPDSYKIYSENVAQTESIVGAGQECIAQLGVPDIVLACAGMSAGVDTKERGDLDVMAQTFATNNLGTAATFHPFIAPMVARGSGTLVGMASVNGIRGFAGHGANCPSKAAMINYLECLRLELRASGVKVVTICPGYVDTPLTRDNQASMPFLLQPQDFAERAFRAIQAQASYRVIPWQMAWVAKALRLLPNVLFDRAFAGRARKPRLPSA
jgi:short-subunit dehydrogenase